MNALGDADGSCLALLTEWIGTRSLGAASPEVKRLQSLAQLGVDIYSTNLRMEENLLQKTEIEERMVEIVHDLGKTYEQHSLYLRCVCLDTEYSTLGKALNILNLTSGSVENRVLMQRMQNIMQETVQRHEEMNEDAVFDGTATESSMVETFEKIHSNHTTCTDALNQMHENVCAGETSNKMQDSARAKNGDQKGFEEWKINFIKKLPTPAASALRGSAGLVSATA